MVRFSDQVMVLAAGIAGVCLGVVVIDYLWSWFRGERGDRQGDVFK